MEEDKELPSDSDSDDEDYVPEGVTEKVSEESEGEKSESDDEETEAGGGKKRKRNETKENTKKIKAAELKINENTGQENVENPEEVKARKDRLWADFMKDCGSSAKPAQKKSEPPIEEKEKEEETANKTEVKESSKIKVTQVVEFAGEKMTIEKEVDKSTLEGKLNTGNARGRGRGRSSAGLSAVLGMFGKKGNLSTLEKSKLDWDKFKQDEGIQEQLQSHNRGRNGYLEKQDFLQRTDVRQFELEKEMRSSRRSNR